ncbi:MAG: type II secretion system F family protein [Planctomycetales bacterium]|nr:type II secretion system F family protein [Planctomycetales bacterium]
MVNILFFVSFFAISGFVFLVGRTASQMQRNPVRERLGAAVSRNLAALGAPLPIDLAESPQISNPASQDEIDREIRQAGWYRPYAKRDFLALRNALVIFTLIAAGGAAVWFGPEQPDLVRRCVLFGLTGIGLCWALPRLYLRTQATSRVTRIQRGLPDAMDLLTMCMTGGMSLNDSFEHVARDIYFAHPDLAAELVIVKEQMDMRSAELAFQQFAERTQAPEIASLASLITQGQRLGTDVAGSIRSFADGMRLRRRQLADEQSNKAGVKMLFPLTMCLLPSVFIILWGPSVLELWTWLNGLTSNS